MQVLLIKNNLYSGDHVYPNYPDYPDYPDYTDYPDWCNERWKCCGEMWYPWYNMMLIWYNQMSRQDDDVRLEGALTGLMCVLQDLFG